MQCIRCAKTAEPIWMPFGKLTRMGPRSHIILGVEIPTESGNFWVSRSLKSIGSLCCGVCSKRDHSIINNGMRARLLQPTAMLSTGRCRIIFSVGKNPPPAMRAFAYYGTASWCVSSTPQSRLAYAMKRTRPLTVAASRWHARRTDRHAGVASSCGEFPYR